MGITLLFTLNNENYEVTKTQRLLFNTLWSILMGNVMNRLVLTYIS